MKGIARAMKAAVLGILVGMPGVVFADGRDSLLLDLVFSYRRNYVPEAAGATRNLYLKYTFNTERRNFTLVFVPTMYPISRGERDYIGESYGKITFRDIDNYSIDRQFSVGTIPHNRRAMPIMVKYLTPNVYGATLFGGEILSPFHRDNRRFYRYRVSLDGEGRSRIAFRPRTNNTQLTRGYAVADSRTGRIVEAHFEGEYGLVRFSVDVDMGVEAGEGSLLPRRCDSRAVFRFVGNKLRVRFLADYEGQHVFTDSVAQSGGLALMERVRPDTLAADEQAIYDAYAERQAKADSAAAHGDGGKKRKSAAERAWDVWGDRLLNSIGAENDRASIRISPLFNPFYLSYSRNLGLSYRMNIGARYHFTPTRSLSLEPQLGYNFKIKRFYYTAPLRFTINSRKDVWVELTFANGNIITNSSVLEILNEENRDTVDFSALELDYFKDQSLQLLGNARLTPELALTLGMVYHKRTAVNRESMLRAGKPDEYRSFAPLLTLTLTPIRLGPVFTINYERGISGPLRSNIAYERWEFDASYTKAMSRLRRISLRLGGGFYTEKRSSYFVDFSNFHENYLPGGWADDWTGRFHLLNSEWYNASRYYIRANATYESPLMLLSRLPLVGRFVETERLYAGALQIQHMAPYTEWGYGVTTGYFSFGLFAGFVGLNFHQFGTKFSFELFRNW